MNQQPVYTFAKWQVQEGKLEVVLQLLAQVAAKTVLEDGNLFYNIHQSNSDKNTLILFEGYTGDSAVEAHRQSDYFQQLVVQQIVPHLDNREVILASRLDLG